MAVERRGDNIGGSQIPWFVREFVEAEWILNSMGRDDPTVVPAIHIADGEIADAGFTVLGTSIVIRTFVNRLH